jgi:hypothetical protein
MRRSAIQNLVVVLLAVPVSACNSGSTSLKQTPHNAANSTPPAQSTHHAVEATTNSPARQPKQRKVAPVEIQGGQPVNEGQHRSAVEDFESVRAALKPFQVLLGRWNGTSRKAVVDHPEWAYDWVSDPKQPGLRLHSEQGTYVREGRLSYLPDVDQFEFKSTDGEGLQRTFRGAFTQPVQDVASDEKKLQRTYKLQLTEPEPGVGGEQWRITFNQQENNRYILELDRKRGAGNFLRVDTVHTQREGTSFALSDADYGDKTCIISQGLGTISVSFKGQTYWVCCTGCKAAFEDEPEKWIAKFEEKKKSMGK